MSDPYPGVLQAVALLTALHHRTGDVRQLIADYIAEDLERDHPGWPAILDGLVGATSYLLTLRELETGIPVAATLQLIAASTNEGPIEPV